MIGSKFSHGLGVVVEAPDSIADQVRGRFVARDEQENAEAQELLFCEMFAIDLRGQQCTDQVVFRLLAALLDYPFEVIAHFHLWIFAVGRSSADELI